jgi:EmrB/QacA subfamily drug resistance transporter
MKLPCDEAVIKSGYAVAACSRGAAPWILAATILGSSMAFVDSTVVNVALPALQSNLGGTVVDVQWVVEAYGLLLSALILVGGSMGDLYGRRKMFLSGVVVFAFASVACGLASNIHQLVAARAIQGIGAAFLVPGSLAIISASFPEKERGAAIGTWSGFTAIMAAMGPVLGGWLIVHASWRWAFFINLPVAVAVITICVWRVPETRSSTLRSVDWVGALTETAALGGLAYGFIESASLGWENPFVWGSLTLGSVFLIAFLFYEARARVGLVPFELFRSRDFSGANVLTFFLYAALGVFFFLVPLNLIQVQGYSATAAGAASIPLIALIFLLSRWSGELIARYGPRRPLIIGPNIAAAGFLLFALPSVGGSYWTTFFPAYVVLGIGMAVSVAPLTTVVLNSVDPDHAGTASGINNAVARVAGLLAVAIVGVVMVTLFSVRFDRNLGDLTVPPGAAQELRSNEVRLAALVVPAQLDAHVALAVRTSIDDAFIFAFRFVMFSCAALSVAGALCTWRWIGISAGKSRGWNL